MHLTLNTPTNLCVSGQVGLGPLCSLFSNLQPCRHIAPPPAPARWTYPPPPPSLSTPLPPIHLSRSRIRPEPRTPKKKRHGENTKDIDRSLACDVNCFPWHLFLVPREHSQLSSLNLAQCSMAIYIFYYQRRPNARWLPLHSAQRR